MGKHAPSALRELDAKIKAAKQMKAHAVEEEDYDLAKSLKQTLEKLKSKREALAKDFAAAKPSNKRKGSISAKFMPEKKRKGVMTLKNTGETIIGRRVEVLGLADEPDKWFAGTIKKFNSRKRSYTIVYDIGEEEEGVTLPDETIRFIEEEEQEEQQEEQQEEKAPKRAKRGRAKEVAAQPENKEKPKGKATKSANKLSKPSTPPKPPSKVRSKANVTSSSDEDSDSDASDESESDGSKAVVTVKRSVVAKAKDSSSSGDEDSDSDDSDGSDASDSDSSGGGSGGSKPVVKASEILTSDDSDDKDGEDSEDSEDSDEDDSDESSKKAVPAAVTMAERLGKSASVIQKAVSTDVQFQVVDDKIAALERQLQDSSSSDEDDSDGGSDEMGDEDNDEEEVFEHFSKDLSVPADGILRLSSLQVRVVL
jgi:hypothetical protein